MNLHPQVIEREGRKEFVVLPYDEFLKVQETLQDYEDLRDLRRAKADGEGDEAVTLDQARKILLEES